MSSVRRPSLPVPPTALERLRNQMRDNQSQTQRLTIERETLRSHFRESVKGYLADQELAKAPMSRRDLQELTDVQFFVSFSFINFCSFCCVLSVTFCLGWMGWGRDIKGDYKTIHDQYQVS